MKILIKSLCCSFACLFIAIPALACDYTLGSITSISSSGSVTEGTVLTINGSGFGTPTNIGNGEYDRSVYMFYNSPEYPGWGEWGYQDNIRGSSVFCFGGGGCSRGMNDFVSWSNTKIEIEIPNDFEQGGVVNAINAGINRISAYIVIGEYNRTGTYISADEICGNPDNGDDSSFDYQPSCTDDIWSCGNWNTCPISGSQSRSCEQTFDCPFDSELSPETSQSCTPECTADTWSCNDWSICALNGTQARSCSKTYDCSLIDTSSPSTSQSCTPECTADTWSCGDWGSCSSSSTQSRSCSKTYDCPIADTSSPTTSQSCTYTPTCTEDTWSCSSWGECSPNGIESRTCTKTDDCSVAETAPPTTSQFCQSSSGSTVQPSTGTVANQDAIVKATVKLLCPVSSTMASQGTGTVIDSSGTILTNKHVVEGTMGCLVGFIDSFDDEPYFGSRQIADIVKYATNEDIAILKLRNPSSASLTSTSISSNSSSTLQLGESLHVYGYPARFGDQMTYTSGDFSGVDGNYLKTTAVLEYGNSGGGAYTSSGKFIGIPSAVAVGELNSLGYILSVNTVNSWMNNTSLSYTPNTNNYSRVSVLDDVDLGDLDDFQLYLPGSELLVDESATSDSSSDDSGATTSTTESSLISRVVGRILLQVEDHGEAWYVNPADSIRYYMKDGATAYEMMRYFSLGITNADLAKIPSVEDTTEANSASSVCGTNSLANSVRGKILLQVEQHGEAWYVDPDTCNMIYMEDGDSAYTIMRFLSLGITNDDLSKIPSGEI